MFNKAFFAALILAAAPVFAPAAFAEGDGPGPNLVIEVAGAANGEIVIDLDTLHAPKHVAQIVALAKSGAYDGVVFHRVIDGFMAQTGDVQYGKSGGDLSGAGMGGSDMPNIPAEFSDVPFARGTVGMARSQDPDSANSQFFIMFAPGDFLNGQYTVIGQVIKGMDVVDAIQRGEPPATPDVMVKVTVQE
jgi:peptidylprolyl isomerase